MHRKCSPANRTSATITELMAGSRAACGLHHDHGSGEIDGAIGRGAYGPTSSTIALPAAVPIRLYQMPLPR